MNRYIPIIKCDPMPTNRNEDIIYNEAELYWKQITPNEYLNLTPQQRRSDLIKYDNKINELEQYE